MTDDLIIWTYDWVPEMPRGYVRDLRLRWALEEAGLHYTVRTVPFEDRGSQHFARQPFAQVPFLEDGEIKLFESGAALLHLAEQSEALMPRDPIGAAETKQWVIAALNSIEMVSVPWWFLKISGDADNALGSWLGKRLDQLEAVLQDREWLAASRFTVADILMADVLRVPDIRSFAEHRVLSAYVDRVTARPAFKKAHADQLEHFKAADAARKGPDQSHPPSNATNGSQEGEVK